MINLYKFAYIGISFSAYCKYLKVGFGTEVISSSNELSLELKPELFWPNELLLESFLYVSL